MTVPVWDHIQLDRDRYALRRDGDEVVVVSLYALDRPSSFVRALVEAAAKFDGHGHYDVAPAATMLPIDRVREVLARDRAEIVGHDAVLTFLTSEVDTAERRRTELACRTNAVLDRIEAEDPTLYALLSDDERARVRP